ncbi:S1 RNA-binding domain-containing protein 1 [Fundulus heteroclitus]|uniref:S1 RNA-binding domain-containing protein 1 n=1 Tax=Fundulus heteroclitus TaxID=8078 RepID=UPI00165B00AE|nr:S1 RNA-binding domain-containing protein 1 [Fundulus heteroclitus]XP_012720467.2 S1 RNA-binding domain-containing protein 1 [Fundulus heteroclitus]
MMRRPRATTAKPVLYNENENMDSDLSFSQILSSDEDVEEWRPPESTKASSKTARAPTAGGRKAAPKRTAKPKVPKEPKVPKAPKDPKPRAPRKPPAKPKSPNTQKTKATTKSVSAGTKRKQTNEDDLGEIKRRAPNHCPEEQMVEESTRMKEERISFIVSDAHQTDGCADEGTSQARLQVTKKEEPDEDFTFDEASLKRLPTSQACQRQRATLPESKAQSLRNELNMNWDLVELLSTLSCVEQWVCANIIMLLSEENTIPFMVRYRKDMINHMDADAVRDVQMVYEELCALAKKTQSVIQTLKKDGVLTPELEESLRNCRSADDLDHVYSPYKKGSKLTKARRAKALGLEDAATALLNSPHTLDLSTWVKPGTEGLSSVEEVATGMEHILADMIAKDPETLSYIKTLCEKSFVTIQSSVSKTALKEKEQEKHDGGHKKPGAEQNKSKDFDKFQLYFDFTCNVQRIQPHQTLAINRGESLKILTVKVNIPDRVKSEFTRWCINNRWRPKTFAREQLNAIIRNAVEDSYKRLILPFLTRSYRTKLTSAAEKESITMFVRNLRQRLLVCPVRGCVIMGVDPGFRHGCKLAILSHTSQILHTDVVYLHNSGQQREAEKLRHLLIKYSCTKVVIGNGTACRETESFFADLISRRYFHPLDVSYCITNEAGASIYSVSPEAVKEMPDMDPNLRSAVSIGRRVQDPLAELVKIDPKHIGIGTYQHDVSAGALKAALDGVVQECVSFVGVDINITSETLMRHVAGLNAGRARSIAEWREKNGPFINREQLKLVKGMGPKSFQQCAGFIRINPQTLNSAKPSAESGPAAQEKPVTKKGRGKAGGNIPTSLNALDQTCIHPESYHVAERFLSFVGGSVDQIGSAGLKHCVESKVNTSCIEELAKKVDTTPETLKLIIDGLTQPPGFDIRQNFGQADFKRGIVSMSDLRVGAVLTGRVDNTALFGAFVDIGVGRSGLIHKSNITLDKLPVSQRRRSLALGPGERVEVRVLNVDIQRGRIGLDLIRVLQ